jgi:hypothetical protein
MTSKKMKERMTMVLEEEVLGAEHVLGEHAFSMRVT